MMLGWSFDARTAEEVGRLVRVLGKHRYVVEVDHRQVIFGEFLDGGEPEAVLEQGPRLEAHVVRR